MWKWINKRALLSLHDESLSMHGGSSGMRDEGLLDSALVRPMNLALYESPDYADLAAAYGIGLAQNHPFVDGNKRAAFLAVGLFLFLNNQRLTATQVDATLTIFAVASGEMTELRFAQWIREHSLARA